MSFDGANTPQEKDTPTGIVQIRNRKTGKYRDYETVAYRVHKFRDDPQYMGFCIRTSIFHHDDNKVVIRCEIWDANHTLIATGHAEEFREASDINRTSALENAETSAIGRALACLGIGGTEFASANEVENAIGQQDTADTIRSTFKPLLEEAAKMGGSDHLAACWSSPTKLVDPTLVDTKGWTDAMIRKALGKGVLDNLKITADLADQRILEERNSGNEETDFPAGTGA